METPSKSQIILYQTEDKQTRLQVQVDGETVWLSQAQMAELFQTTQQNVSLHLQNIYREGELQLPATHKESLSVRQPNMGLTAWLGSRPRKTDALVPKNYLSFEEIETLNLIVPLYLDFAELQAKSGKLMRMRNWIAKLDDFLRLSDRQILTHAGKVSHEVAAAKAEAEYEKFRVIEDAKPSAVEKDFEEAVKKSGPPPRRKPKKR